MTARTSVNGVLKLVQLDHIKSNRSYLIRLIIFKNGRCNKAKNECRFSHPKICHKFNQFGPKMAQIKGVMIPVNFIIRMPAGIQ